MDNIKKNKPKVESSIIETVAHDLRGVIIKINSLNEMLHEKLKNNNNEEIQQLLFYIKTLCDQGNEITKELLVNCESEAFENKKISLNQLINHQAKTYELLANKKQVVFRTIVPNDQFFCEFNYFKLIRVLDNLFSNALKFTKQDGQIVIKLTAFKNKALITISDTGIGIPNELQKEIFKKYTKAKRNGTNNETCTGLGLYITHKIIELYKGKIWFDSKVNKGTNFYVELATIDEKRISK